MKQSFSSGPNAECMIFAPKIVLGHMNNGVLAMIPIPIVVLVTEVNATGQDNGTENTFVNGDFVLEHTRFFCVFTGQPQNLPLPLLSLQLSAGF